MDIIKRSEIDNKNWYMYNKSKGAIVGVFQENKSYTPEQLNVYYKKNKTGIYEMLEPCKYMGEFSYSSGYSDGEVKLYEILGDKEIKIGSSDDNDKIQPLIEFLKFNGISTENYQTKKLKSGELVVLDKIFKGEELRPGYMPTLKTIIQKAVKLHEKEIKDELKGKNKNPTVVPQIFLPAGKPAPETKHETKESDLTKKMVYFSELYDLVNKVECSKEMTPLEKAEKLSDIIDLSQKALKNVIDNKENTDNFGIVQIKERHKL